MTTVLYHGEPNGPSLAVLAALFETGLDIERRHIDLLAGERHSIPGLAEPLARDMGIEGEGPVLVIDGEAMTEAVFIAQYLDEAAGGVGLQPRDPYTHWEMTMWCRRVTERGSPAQAWLGCRAYAHQALAALDDSQFDAITSRIVSEDLRRRWVDVRCGDFSEESTNDSVSKIEFGTANANSQLADGRDWLMGAFSIADLVSFSLAEGALDLLPSALDGRPHILSWMERVRSRPSVRRAFELATVAEPQRSWAPGPEINRWG